MKQLSMTYVKEHSKGRMWPMMHVLNTLCWVQAHTSAQNPWELHMSRNVVYVLQSIVISLEYDGNGLEKPMERGCNNLGGYCAFWDLG